MSASSAASATSSSKLTFNFQDTTAPTKSSTCITAPITTSSTGLQTITNNPSSTPTGLSTGAIAGIAVGIAVPIIFFALAIYICLHRRRHSASKISKTGDIDNTLPELLTETNTHELLSSEEKPELSSKPHIQPPIQSFSQTLPAHAMPAHAMKSEAYAPQEMYANELYVDPTQSNWVNIDEMSSSPRAVTASMANPQLSSPSQSPGLVDPDAQRPISTSSDMSPSSAVLPISLSSSSGIETSSEQSFSRLDILRNCIDRVRAEKERLARVQELDHLEAELQHEIMEEQRKEMGLLQHQQWSPSPIAQGAN